MPAAMFTPRRLARGLVALCVPLTGCHHEPTYYEDVRPLLAAHCTSCHTKTGVAPVPVLDSFDAAKAAAGNIRHAVQAREMPPWGAENTGLCSKWRDAQWLEDVFVIG